MEKPDETKKADGAKKKKEKKEDDSSSGTGARFFFPGFPKWHAETSEDGEPTISDWTKVGRAVGGVASLTDVA